MLKKTNPVVYFVQSLIEKYGQLRVVVLSTFIGLAILSSPVLISNAAENARLQAKFDNYLALADKRISSESFDEAIKALNKASLVKPNEAIVDSKKNKIRVQKADINKSKTFFQKAQSAESKGKKLEALNLYLKVTKHKYKIDEVAAKRVAVLQNELVKAELKKAYQKSLTRQYAEAAIIIRKAMKVLPSDANLNKALSRYKEQYSKQRRAEAFSKMRAKYDNFNETTWYRDYSSPVYINMDGFFLQFSLDSNGDTNLYLKMQYFADDWLFIDKASVNIDGETYLLDQEQFDRDNNSSIWEWQTIHIFAETTNELVLGRDIIEKIAKSRSAIVRYSGSEYYHDEYISQTQKRAMRNVLNAYDAASK